MDNLKQLVAKIEDNCTEIYEEIDLAEEKGFKYKYAKDIRKLAQLVKVNAQTLREKTTAQFKKLEK